MDSSEWIGTVAMFLSFRVNSMTQLVTRTEGMVAIARSRARTHTHTHSEDIFFKKKRHSEKSDVRRATVCCNVPAHFSVSHRVSSVTSSVPCVNEVCHVHESRHTHEPVSHIY